MHQHNLPAVAGQFQVWGDFREAQPYGSGHINDTYAAVFSQAGAPVRYILQRINHRVFRHPVLLMENVERVTRHIREKLAALEAPALSRRVLTLVPTRDGKCWHQDADGNYWRCYLFIEGAQTYDQITTPAQAFAAAKAFGQFQKQLADLPAPRLHDTIPQFHHTRHRFDTLLEVMAKDPCNRAQRVKPEIEFALRREPMVDVLLNLQAQGALPERVTHNDTKLNNVMLDDATGEGVCVIDLDTVMPGLALYDFGDMCRTATPSAAEDERNLSKVGMRMEMFEALVRGYLASAGEFLNPAEKEHLAFSARLITFNIGIRFLADYLAGDVYFKIHHEFHNVERARVQFRMIECFERNEELMCSLVRDAEAIPEPAMG